MSTRHLGIVSTRGIPNPTYYVQALLGEFSKWAYCEEIAPTLKGKWRSEVFHCDQEGVIDLEIGTGNGNHFAHYAHTNPQNNIVGLEIKFKPLIQAIRRALNTDSINARMVRYNANRIEDLFEAGELNNVFIHHPDPWVKKGQWKNRLIQDDFLKNLYELQQNNTFVEFKTDDRGYFDWAVERFNRGPYKVAELTYDLHNSEFANGNYITTFEKIFLSRNQPIFYAKLIKS